MSEESNEPTVTETEETNETTTPSADNFVESMLNQIDDTEVKDAGFWKNLEGKNANEVGKYIKELQSFAGRKGDIPKDDATDEEWDAFYQKLGRPETIEGYDFSINEEFKELVGEAAPFFDKVVSDFKEKAFQLGATPKAAEDLVGWYLETVGGQFKEADEVSKEETENNIETLRNEWGSSFDGITSQINGLLKSNGMSDEELQWANDIGILTEPSIAIPLANIAKQFADSPEIGHLHTSTNAGIQDQLAEVEMEVADYIRQGKNIPPHIAEKRISLMQKLGDNL